MSAPADTVGPVLEAGATADAIVSVLRARHPELTTIDRGSYVRVLVPRRCELHADAVARALGRPFKLPGDLELVMPSFKGSFSVTEDAAVWECGERDR
jgi:hypothetical protein